MFEYLFGCMASWVKDWGAWVILTLVMLYMIYRFLYKITVSVGLKIVGALEKPSEALSRQAQSMDRLTSSIDTYVSRDQLEHKEIIILQKVILEEIKEIRESQNDRNPKRAL